MGLPTCTPTSVLYDNRAKGGVGMPSLGADYADIYGDTVLDIFSAG